MDLMMQIMWIVTGASISDRGLPGIQVAIRFLRKVVIDPHLNTRGANGRNRSVARNKSHSQLNASGFTKPRRAPVWHELV